MNVLVTGATGFLGQKLAFRLATLGFNVTATGRNRKIGQMLTEKNIRFEPSILEDKERIIELCKNKDYVFHCGALSSPWGKYKNFYDANVLGTKHVIEGCKQANVKRLIHVSTPSLYFYYNERRNVKESDPLPNKFVNHYAETKYLAEIEVDKAFEAGVPSITIRPRAIFGPGDNAILPRLIKVCEKGIFPKFGNGDVEIDLTYVENVVDVLLLCMNSEEKTLGQKYNITNGTSVSLYKMIENVIAQLGISVKYKTISVKKAYFIASLLEKLSTVVFQGKEPLLTKYTVSVLSQTQTLSIEKAKSELGYAPAVSIETGAAEFVEWWKNHEY
ncbi:NAD-dependent epimerase/dehydratase family protein [Metabacillus niabensis]|uniref:Nucleoside-diphosphate-sugar epimerase n=1 Tax=Metabacillus niabensis TaxID=324854 RepID=A0ABT9Z8X5_9BACI|nr:NAD-dependent epimerase/dehydratase family protein [Metabacillus niabensis]MDQ0228048.1 nucleoside-diphosphate-sugar epimerase [Metabacillus niabensis]